MTRPLTDEDLQDLADAVFEYTLEEEWPDVEAMISTISDPEDE